MTSIKTTQIMHLKINITPLEHSTTKKAYNHQLHHLKNLNLNSWWGKRKVKVYVSYLSTIYVLRPLIWGHCGHLKGLVIPNLAE